MGGASGLWARSMRRRHRRATALLVVLVASASGVTMAAVAAARRADGSVDRFLEQARDVDATVFTCPPGVDPNEFDDQYAMTTTCLSEARARSVAAELAHVPGVEVAGIGGAFVVGRADPDASNGWGQVALVIATLDDELGLGSGRPKVLDGRLPLATAADEVMVSEQTAHSNGIEVGDRLRLSSWPLEDLDAAVNDFIPPNLPPVDLRVVGIGRFSADLVPGEPPDLSRNFLGGELHVMGASGRAIKGFANYGLGVLVRLEEGSGGIDHLNRELGRIWSDRMFSVETAATSFGETDPAQRRIDTERAAVLAFAAIAGISTMVFAGLTLVRQLRREQTDLPTLRELGMSRRDLTAGSLHRAAIIAVPAAVGSAMCAIALSPFTPVGQARLAEPDLGVWIDVPVVVVGSGLVLAAVLAVAAGAPRLAMRAERRGAPRSAGRLASLARAGGIAPQAGFSFAQDGWPRVAAAVTVLAVASLVAAGVAARSLDVATSDPLRWGASWDLDMGNFSTRDAYEAGARVIAADRAVATVAGYGEQAEVATIDGRAVDLGAFEAVKGRPGPVVVSGRAPRAADEIALGEGLHRALDVQIGDTVRLASAEGAGDLRRMMTVTGTVLFNNPVTRSYSLGDGAVVPPEVLNDLSSFVPQQILVGLEPAADRDAAVARLAKRFEGGIRPATAPDDVRNLERLHRLPWFLAGLVGALASVTVAHALVVTVLRRRRDLAVLSVMGVDRWGIRRITASTTLAIVSVAVVVGVPIGFVVGRALWRFQAGSADLLSGPVIDWVMPVVVIVAVHVVAQAVTLLTTARSTRVVPAELLRAD